MLQASVTGLEPKRPYVMALSSRPDGGGVLEPIAGFTSNPTGSAIANTVGSIRRLVEESDNSAVRFLVIAEGTAAKLGVVVQVQNSAVKR